VNKIVKEVDMDILAKGYLREEMNLIMPGVVRVVFIIIMRCFIFLH